MSNYAEGMPTMDKSEGLLKEKLSDIRRELYNSQDRARRVATHIDCISGAKLKDMPSPIKDPGEPKCAIELIDLIRSQLSVLEELQLDNNSRLNALTGM